MILSKLRKDPFFWGVILLIVSLVIYKAPTLTLPYFWDEAWPYSVAISTLYENNLVFYPTSIPPDVSRGHPLMFHFLAALWMKIFGTSLMSGHSFSLFTSSLLLLSIYFFCRKFFNSRVGFVACALLAVQGVFVANSAFLMPEVMMSLWTVLCLYFFFSDYKWLYWLAGAAMILTKESGVVLIGTIGLMQLFSFFISKERNYKILFKDLVSTGLPILIAFIYFFFQWIEFGWFLFPYHIDQISFGSEILNDKLPQSAAYVFIYTGRNALSIALLLSAVFIMYKKVKFSDIQRKILLCLFLFTVVFIIFSSVNFFIPRYLLCSITAFILVASVFIDKAIGRFKFLYFLLMAGLMGTYIYYFEFRKETGELAYLYSTKTHQQVVTFLEDLKLQNNYIYAEFVLRNDLVEPAAGYLRDGKFNKVQFDPDDQTEYWVLTSEEFNQSKVDHIRATYAVELLKRFENGRSWTEVYKVRKK